MMTYTAVCRRAARMDAMALRAWAKAGRVPPKHQPVDYWDEWCRSLKTSSTTRREAA